MDNLNINLEECFDEETNSYAAHVMNASTKYGDLKEPWHVQALIAEQCDLKLLVATPISGGVMFATKVKKVINLDYPDRGWFTLVMDVQINGEVMEAWLTDRFNDSGCAGIMFYPERRLARLHDEVACHQCNTKNGCAYDKGEGPEQCPILTKPEGTSATDKNGYLAIDPWTYLRELGAQIAILGASCSEEPEIKAQCQHTIDTIIELERMLNIIPI